MRQIIQSATRIVVLFLITSFAIIQANATLQKSATTDTYQLSKYIDSVSIVHDKLNPKIWEKGILKPNIRKQLLTIANTFIKQAKLPNQIKIKDIILAGSIAGYNYSQYSDLDIHIVVSLSKKDKNNEFLKRYLKTLSIDWNRAHNQLSIYEYPVEFFILIGNDDSDVQYSIKRNRWLKKQTKPEKLSQSILNKAHEMSHEKWRIVKQTINQYKKNPLKFECTHFKQLAQKLSQARSLAFKKYGTDAVFMPENLAYKVIRRKLETEHNKNIDEYLGDQLYNECYDKQNTIP